VLRRVQPPAEVSLALTGQPEYNPAFVEARRQPGFPEYLRPLEDATT
jgi:hypothetical protein